MLGACHAPSSEMLEKMGMKHIAIGQRLVTETTMGRALVGARRNGDVAEVFIDGIYRAFLRTIGNYRDSPYGGFR